LSLSHLLLGFPHTLLGRVFVLGLLLLPLLSLLSLLTLLTLLPLLSLLSLLSLLTLLTLLSLLSLLTLIRGLAWRTLLVFFRRVRFALFLLAGFTL
jgi:hypothetical protein